ncbi:MAG TPA: hypothetical protein VF978_07680 [Gemmatimonadales bacterium]
MKTATRPWRARRSGSCSLDEAARIYRELRTKSAGAAACPQCGGELHPIVGAEGGEAGCLLRCESCGRSLVVREVLGATPVS